MNVQILITLAAFAAVCAAIILWPKRTRRSKLRDTVPFAEDLLAPFARPAIAVIRGQSAFSRIGGLPDLPQSYEWPVDPKGKPLAFLCQIALQELPTLSRDLGLPEGGALLFFYCQNQSFGGDFPDHAAGWRVIYLSETPLSQARETPTGLKPKHIYKSASLGFSTVTTYAEPNDAQMDALGIDDDDYIAFLEGVDRPLPHHIIGGSPDNLHDLDMEEQCELASNGIKPHDRKAYNSPEAVAMRQRPRDWRLLLQLDSDDDAGMNWGDGGILYFWIRASDLAAKDFSKVWMMAQCY